KQAALSFIEKNSIVHCLDMDSKIKDVFLEKFDSIILKPRGLHYKVQFSGPTGTNAVEAAVKLSRIVTKRRKIISFTHSFHGMSATSFALSGSLEANHKINPAQDVIFFPYDNFFGEKTDTLEYLKKMISEPGSGVELPAAIILETVQAEGGINIAGIKWLQGLREFTSENGILLIVDDIQVGCGRTGGFFSFERAGIVPDLVLLSKSISGFGLPLSLVLIKPEFDLWKPGEHNGTFRANNLSLCTASEALNLWKDGSLEKSTESKANRIGQRLGELMDKSGHVRDIRGIGMIWGVEFENGSIAKKIARSLFSQGMLIEACGNDDQVLKLLPPLTISEKNLDKGLDMLVHTVLNLESISELVVSDNALAVS
ncbi:MAG TPA: diaminobutyrate--2-oxoglutarate transaminase, partial [Cyclobacteriaceae bacterium]|nr:diaminobutyrate--2-oxoglutarate transaminase [Cyclobacteriaceae bacterium]